MALRTKSHEEIVAENTFDGMQDIIQPEDEVPEGYESIEEVTDGVDLEDLIKEDEEEEESSESSEEEDVLEKSSDIDENEDDDDDFWNLLDAVENDDEDYDEDKEESSPNLVMVNSVYESLADKVNQITELMSDMASTEHESGVYASDVMVDRMCDHIQKALDNLRPCLKKKLVEEFKW